MTPRPSIAGQSKQRPLSAIYIGSSTSTSTPPDLPRLPEPPSPGGSSNGSQTGLPSPPATNSTGSVGDDSGTAHGGSLRKRPSTTTHRSSYSVPSVSSLVDMYDGQSNLSRRSSKNLRNSNNNHPSTSNLTDEEDEPAHDNDDEHDEDTTARFDSLSRRTAHRTPAKGDEHSSALQRVKSLTERNRMVLNKLSSIQRLSSPTPYKPSRSPYSPPDDSPTPHSRTSTASSRPSTSMVRDAPISFTPSHLQRVRNERTHSGSETERESRRSHSSYAHHQHSSSDSMSATPTSAYAEPAVDPLLSASYTSDRDRQAIGKNRRMSAPVSPGQDFLKLKDRERPRDASPEPTPGPSQVRTPRKRSSHSAAYVEREEHRRRQAGDERKGEGSDIMAAALAAVATSRAESVGASATREKRVSRNPLPGTFRDSMEGDSTYVPAAHRHESGYTRSRRSTPSPSTRASGSNVVVDQRSPRRRESTRTSTVRELTRRHQTRMFSDEMTSPHGNAEDDTATPSRSRTSTSNYAASGRRQSVRHGSDDSLLSPSKRLFDEGFRSAGIQRRDGGARDNIFVNGHADTRTPTAQSRRTHSTGAQSVVFGEDEQESPVSGASSSNFGRPPRPSDLRTPGNTTQRLSDRPSAYHTPASRPGTSMAALHHERVPQSAPPASRPYRVSHEREASTSAVTLDGRPPSSSQADRTFQTPSSGRLSTAPGTAARNHAEHRQLMLNALGMFESQLQRLPPMGQTTTTTIPEVFQSSQHFVHALDKLNTLIRTSVSEALEGQIEADIADPSELQATLGELWAKIGCDEREKLRLSDEIVRTTTQFLLGVGKVLREASAGANSATHSRTVSLDDDASRRLAAPDASTSSDRRSSDGRQSRETRRSWDPRDGAPSVNDRLAHLARSHTTGSSRPSSALHSMTRGSSGGSSESKSAKDGGAEQTPLSASSRLSALSSNLSTRRLYTPKDKKVTSDTSTRAIMSSMDSQETVQAYEPSPTPASRHGSLRGHSRVLSSILVAPTLPTLPSESLLLKGKERASASPDNHPGRKVSTSSNMTVRAEGSSLSSVIKPPSATTAVTTSDSPPSMSRAESRSSVATNGVTFSRPSTASISKLNGFQQHTNGLSRTSSTDSSTHASSHAARAIPRDIMSGSETERPKTFAVRGRASLDGARATLVGTSSQASTLNSSRRERRKTITEIFSQVHNK